MNEARNSISSELTYGNALQQSGRSKAKLTIQGRLVSRFSKQIKGLRGCIPISWCLCVQDSPDNPCPCDGPIIWFPEIFVRSRRTVKGGTEGLVAIDLEASTIVFVDDTCEVGGKAGGARLMRLASDGQFEAVADPLWVQEFTPMRIDRLYRALELIEKHPQLSAIAKKKGKGFLASIVAAFEAGWEIGTAIDEETGASGAIADWLYDNFGPWPF